jgi:hypothetical protein
VCVHDLGGSAWGEGTDCSAVDCSEAETACNGEDDDDDGLIDEGFNIDVACSLQGANGCWTSGIYECNEAGTGATCALNGPAAQPTPEVLGEPSCSDLFDNDCDGLTDLDDPDCQTEDEVGLCNGLDDDNDGSVDEDFPELGDPCTVGLGFCERTGVYVCTDDQQGTECDVNPGSASSENEPGDASCNDEVDNDCDGLTDLNDPGCQTNEICDGKDNDGDGAVDEGENFENLGDPCSAGVGACEASGVYVCSADGLETVCNAAPLSATFEGPAGITCTDGVDNDCDGLTDLEDPGCGSADLSVSCALVAVKGNNGKPKPGEPDTDCQGRYEVLYDVDGADDSLVVTAELLALDENGTLLGSIAVENGDVAHLKSRIWPNQPKIAHQGPFVDVSAPVTLLRVTARTDQRIEQAFCSPLPYLDVFKPDGEVVSVSEGDVTEVVVAIPRVDPSSLVVLVDGVDILEALGVDPATDLPGGPFAGTVDINGQFVTVSDLFVRTAPFGSPGANALTMKLQNLGGGGHIVRVGGDPLAGAVPSDVAAPCHVDDLADTGTVAVFGIEITSPMEGEVTNTIPTPVVGEVRHGHPIVSAHVNGLPLDVTGQVFTPGDGVNSTDLYVLPIDVELPQSDLSAGPQPGTFDRGQNELNAGAQDDLGNLAFASRIFTIGDTVAPSIEELTPAIEEHFREIILQAAEEEFAVALQEDTNLQNAIIFGVSGDGIQTFFSSVCENVNDRLMDKIGETLINVPPQSVHLSIDGACDPWVELEAFTVSPIGSFSCNVTPDWGKVNVSVGLPGWEIVVRARGGCCDCWWIFCWSRVDVNAYVDVYIQNMSFNYGITEQLALAGGEADSQFIEGQILSVDRGSGIDIGCFMGFLEDLLQILTLGFVDLEGNLTKRIKDIFSFEHDIGEALRQKSQDPLTVKKLKINEDEIAQVSDLKFFQTPVDVEMNPEGLTVSLLAEFQVPFPDPELETIPQATLTPAPAPQFPMPGGRDVFSAVSDDVFNFLFAGLTLQGALKTECIESGLVVGDLLPADCDALGTDLMSGRCKGAKGVDCSTIPVGERLGCALSQQSFENRHITPATPLLFCAARGLAPRILIEDEGATEEVVESRLHLNDLRVNVVLDRDANGLNGAFATTPQCFGLSGFGTGDCKWAAACFDMDLAMDLTLDTSTNGSPQIVPELGAVLGNPQGVQCEGAQSFGGDDNLLSQAGASDPIAAIEENIDKLTPLFQTDGLNFGGFVGLKEDPMLVAFETAVQPDCATCQEYIGVIGDIRSGNPGATQSLSPLGSCIDDEGQRSASCDNGSYCDGEEVCVSGTCQAGTSVDCEDGNACTDDACNEYRNGCDNLCNATGPEDACCSDPACAGEPHCAGACIDYDGDGCGSPSSEACPYPEQDCDDRNPHVNPRTAEVVGNGVDDDCDPSTPDEQAQTLWSAAAPAEASEVAARAHESSYLFNLLTLVLVPAGMVFLMKRTRRRR